MKKHLKETLLSEKLIVLNYVDMQEGLLEEKSVKILKIA